MPDAQIDDGLRNETRAAWHLDILVPFRPQLHAYCRKLTGDIWDAEDLVQDTLLKGFATLGSVHGEIANQRGYLTRIATNLWLDTQRRRVAEARALGLADGEVRSEVQPDTADSRRAGAALFERLAPQERAALVLKEVFDMSLKEIAEMLTTSENAVKAALHRGRMRLKDDAAPRRASASPALIDEFIRRLDASDLSGLLALMLDTATIEMPGALVETGRAEFGRKGSWLWQAVNVHPDMPADCGPRSG
jgi:RNA polymerase sigma-70 factor (ECF subfamily)